MKETKRRKIAVLLGVGRISLIFLIVLLFICLTLGFGLERREGKTRFAYTTYLYVTYLFIEYF